MKLRSLLVALVVWTLSVAAAYWWGHRSGGAGGASLRVTGVSSDATGPSKPKAPGQRGPGGKGTDGSAVEPGGVPSLQQILAQVKGLMRTGGMNNPSAMIKVLGLLGQIRDEDIAEALTIAEDIKEPQAKMMLNMVLLSRWAEKDGPAALKYAEEKLSNQGPMMNMAKMGVLSSWAQSDPDAAWAYLQKEDGGDSGGGPMGGRGMMIMGLFSSLAAKDVDLALTRAQSLTDKQEKAMALTGISQTAYDDASRKKIMDEISKVPDVAERKEARGIVLGQLAMLEPDKAIELVKGLPADERGDASTRVGSMMLMSDPKKGAAFMLENAEPEKKGPVYDQVVNMWANSDANAAGAWLGEQPQGPELDGARASFSRIVASKDPESAMEWAKTISTDDSRGQAVEQVYGQWVKKDAAAANASLESSGLTPERIQQIRTATPAR